MHLLTHERSAMTQAASSAAIVTAICLAGLPPTESCRV